MSTIRARAVGSLPLPVDMANVDLPPWFSIQTTNCLRTEDPNLFFPDSYGLRHRKQVREAKDTCVGCPALAECLEWAVGIPSLEGIWAGTTPPERRRIRTKGDPRAA
jgi:WhiB family redox-sensing transcriptional regulator